MCLYLPRPLRKLRLRTVTLHESKLNQQQTRREMPVIEGATSTPAPTILPPSDATLTDAVPEAPVSRPATQVIDLTQDDEPSQPPRLGSRTLAKASSLGKRPRASSPRVVVPAKRACLGTRISLDPQYWRSTDF
ncbi:hypothetical protein HBH98_032520 [Parastagonospora nodorum]|nr:hypothetical protein HBH51_003670 [Parastagonospora nodorum]KAH4004826.1 hypothetical protein HBI10_042170 [Parastagonospora nodorum]KAH4030844.1 hypothetical protein HBI13_025620 [Parastagonospora nodorum]KAH4056271.1 hypothetical protein HBH49_051440 [Parastagonospora nodorum]KAH4071261.1 hypothetical protein HBH50_078540 [Parastagonospora nodorum]